MSVEELVQDEFYAAAEQIERMSLPQFEQLLSPLFNTSEYNEETDFLELYLSLDEEYGIEVLEYVHARINEDTIPENVDYAETDLSVIDENSWELHDIDDPTNDIGVNMIKLVHPTGSELTSGRLMQGIYDALLDILANSSPSIYTMNPTAVINLYEHPEQEIDVTKVHGEQWEIPDPGPDESAQIPKLPDDELIASLEAVDTSPHGSKCSARIRGCSKTVEQPDDPTREERNKIHRKQQEQLIFQENESIRGVAVITRNYDNSEEIWEFEDTWHPECAPSKEEFLNEYESRKSVGKWEVLVEGKIQFGELLETIAGDYHEAFIKDIDIIGIKGEYEQN